MVASSKTRKRTTTRSVIQPLASRFRRMDGHVVISKRHYRNSLAQNENRKKSFSVLSIGAVGINIYWDLILSLESVTALITISGCDQPRIICKRTFYAL